MAPDRPPADPPNTSAKSASSPAQRLAAWTSRGIVSAIIVLMGLTAGRQVISWWHAPQAAPVVPNRSSSASRIGSAGVAHTLEFSAIGWNLRRVEFQGDRAAAQAALLEVCKKVVPTAAMPKEPANDAELRFLQDIHEQTPLAADGAAWGVYHVEGPFPILVGVRPCFSASRNAGPPVAVSGCRVVTWGMATPVGQNHWTVYAFGASGGGQPASAAGIDIPLPPGCARHLVVRAERGECVTSFRGPGPVADWIRSFDQWFRSHGWKTDSDGQARASSYQIRYRAPGARGATADLHLHDTASEAQGFIVITGANEGQKPEVGRAANGSPVLGKSDRESPGHQDSDHQ